MSKSNFYPLLLVAASIITSSTVFGQGADRAADGLQLRVTNAASYQENSGISPGAIITVFAQPGAILSPETLSAPDPAHLPKSLGGVTLLINGVESGIYFVSPTQVSARVDESVRGGLAFVTLQTPISSGLTKVMIEPTSSTGIFTLSGSGSNDGAVLNAVTFAGGSFSAASGGSPMYLALFVNGLDLSAMPTVWIGGTSVPVSFFGAHPLYEGLQQINVQLTPQLAGLGRIEVVVEQSGHRSNAVEVTLLPQQRVFADDEDNQVRSRELASVAWVPGTSTALVVDENDDVVRVLDIHQGSATRVIALPDGAQPVAVGVWGNGTLALVALRGRNSIAVVDLTSNSVDVEIPVGRAPSAIAVAGDTAVIVNADSDSVSFFNFQLRQVFATSDTGRLPRGVAVDSLHVYVTNQSDGSITVLDLASGSAVNTFHLGVNVRPGAINVLDDTTAVVSEPSAGPGGKLLFVNLLTGKVMGTADANPERTGGASSIAVLGNRIYLANQSGGSVTMASATVNTLGATISDPRNVRVDLGPRALAVDPVDNLLLVANQGSGTIALVDLSSNTLVGRIDAVRSLNEVSDDRSDHDSALNLPIIDTISPSSAQAGAVFTLDINGKNLSGATDVLFLWLQFNGARVTWAAASMVSSTPPWW